MSVHIFVAELRQTHTFQTCTSAHTQNVRFLVRNILLEQLAYVLPSVVPAQDHTMSTSM